MCFMADSFFSRRKTFWVLWKLISIASSSSTLVLHLNKNTRTEPQERRGSERDAKPKPTTPQGTGSASERCLQTILATSMHSHERRMRRTTTAPVCSPNPLSKERSLISSDLDSCQ